MKNKIFIHTLTAFTVAVALSSCDENSWNDHLDGFEEFDKEPITDVRTLEYTLTDADYKLIASNSENIALAGDDNEKKTALAAVGTRMAFSEKATAAMYVPAFFSSTSFPYFTLSDGSSVSLTYNEAEALSPEIEEAAAAQEYTVSSYDYQFDVWGSEEDFIDAFAPEKPASSYLPAILANNLVEGEGRYALVTYNVASQNPVFGNVGGGEDEPSFELSREIANIALDDEITVNAIVTAICAQGYMIADASGALFVYAGSSFDTSSVAIGDQVVVSGTVGAYNKGFQIVANKADVPYSVEVVGHEDYQYPAPVVYTGAELDAAIARSDNDIAIYARMSGTAVVTEKNINIKVEGAETAMGSVYQGTEAQKALFVNDAQVTVDGYFIAIAGGRYCSVVITAVNGAPVAAAPARFRAPAAAVPAQSETALYVFNNNRWSRAEGFVALSASDYTAMGQNYPNLSAPAEYLPKYLSLKYPYAQEGNQVNVVYKLYASGKTSTACDPYIYNGSEWKLDLGIKTVTNQFVRSEGKWMYDPNVTITLPAGRGQEVSTLYYQACVDWVYENICVPLGDTSIKSGKFYVSSYGNNEYYSGTSAYQGNVDLRGNKAIEQYPAGYEGMTEEEVVELEKKRFVEEVMPGALAKIHDKAVPVSGMDVIYTVNFYYYTGTQTLPAVAHFKVVGPAKFEAVDCDWNVSAE